LITENHINKGAATL